MSALLHLLSHILVLSATNLACNILNLKSSKFSKAFVSRASTVKWTTYNGKFTDSSKENKGTNRFHRNVIEALYTFKDSTSLDKHSLVLKSTVSPLASNQLSLASPTALETALGYIKNTRLYKRLSEILGEIRERLSNLSWKEQLLLMLSSQFVYSFILPHYHFLLPYQLLPIDAGIGVDVGLDTIVSILLFVRFIRDMSLPITDFSVTPDVKRKIPLILASLMGTYFMSGYFVLLVDHALLFASAVDIPISSAMHQSLRLLTGHLFWVVIGTLLLKNTILPISTNVDSNWYKLNVHENWIYKTLAGYFTSCTLYNVSDFIYHLIMKLNKQNFEVNDSIVTQLTNSNELLSTLVGSIGPCITAPWWEEIVYRVFILKSLNLYLPKYLSTLISSLLFALHHMNPHNTLHLLTLGLIWAVLEQKFNNTLITILIHSLWNSRILISNLTGR